MSEPVTSAISQEPFLAVNWAWMRVVHPQEAADSLETILRRLDAIEDQVYAARGMAGLIFEERRLHELTGQSFDSWLKATCPKSWGYVRDAMRTVAALRDTPFTDLVQIKRCNLKVLETVSSEVRCRTDVIENAKLLSERDFRENMVARFPDQHISQRQKMVLTFDSEDYQTVCEWLDEVGEKVGLTDREGQILALAIDWKMEKTGA